VKFSAVTLGYGSSLKGKLLEIAAAGIFNHQVHLL